AGAALLSLVVGCGGHQPVRPTSGARRPSHVGARQPNHVAKVEGLLSPNLVTRAPRCRFKGRTILKSKRGRIVTTSVADVFAGGRRTKMWACAFANGRVDAL